MVLSLTIKGPSAKTWGPHVRLSFAELNLYCNLWSQRSFLYAHLILYFYGSAKYSRQKA